MPKTFQFYCLFAKPRQVEISRKKFQTVCLKRGMRNFYAGVGHSQKAFQKYSKNLICPFKCLPLRVNPVSIDKPKLHSKLTQQLKNAYQKTFPIECSTQSGYSQSDW